MTIPGWDDEDDSYLCDNEWEEQEAMLIAKRRQTTNLVPQQLPPNSAAPSWNNQQQQQPYAPEHTLQQHPAVPRAPVAQPQFTNQHQQQLPPPQPQQQPNFQQHAGPPPAVGASSIFFGASGGIQNHLQPPPPWYQQQPPPQQQQWNSGGGYPPPFNSYPPQEGNGPPGAYYQQQYLPPPPQQQQYQQQQQQYQYPPQQQQPTAGPQQQPPHPPPVAAPAPPPLAPPMCTMYATLCLPRSGGRTSAIAAGASTSATAVAAAAAASAANGKPVAPMLEVQMGYHECADSALRRVGGGTWDARRRVWMFPLSSHDKILEALKNATGVKIKVEPLHHLPAAVLKSASSIPDDSSRYCHIPKTLEEQLMEFQREGVKFGLLHGGRVLVGDEMGLGKTVQAIALAAAYRDEWPGLIIAPSSLREQWADALHKWLGVTEDRVYIVNTGKDAANVPQKGIDFLIVSYNFLDKMDLLGKYEVVIVDESHYIKDGSAKRTKAALPILKTAKRCFLLTGTPALNRPKEVYTQLSALVPTAKIKMKDFGERYCAGNRFDKYGGAQNLDELHSMLRGSVMVRRLKSEVLSQLPKKRRQQVFLALDAESRRELSGLTKQLESVKQVIAQLAAANIASGGAVSLGGGRMDENRAIMEMYRRTAELKAKAVQEYVEMLLDAGQKFLIFAHHKELMDAIEHSCNRRKGCKFIRIDGSTPSTDRSRLVKSFQDDDSVRVAVLSIKAAGVGLTLTAASTVVFAEMTWTPGEIIQAEDRAHRIGQASAVNVYFLHVRNSVDEIIWNAIQNKLENVGQALDGQDRGMEVTAARTMPERGQKALETYFTQAPAAAAAAGPPLQQHQQQQPSEAVDGGVRKFFPKVVGQENQAAAAAVAVDGGSSGGQKRPRESAL